VIFEHLRKNFPDDIFLGEESASTATKVQVAPAGKRRWIVDPLDGTTNYIHQFPVFCISIGCEVDGQMMLAVVDVPILNEVYTAVHGKGAYLNGQPMQVSTTATLSDAFVATGFFNEIEAQLVEQLRIFAHVVRQVRGVRRAGAAAYDLCLVARGVFDLFWERGLQPWDSAAGLLLVREAGGDLITYRGHVYHPFKNSVIAGNKTLIGLLQKEIQPHLASDSD
jgi:myo-inositol-1(or 4)-monophosphatase